MYPPASIQDLTAASVDPVQNTVTLAWTAVGSQLDVGQGEDPGAGQEAHAPVTHHSKHFMSRFVLCRWREKFFPGLPFQQEIGSLTPSRGHF